MNSFGSRHRARHPPTVSFGSYWDILRTGSHQHLLSVSLVCFGQHPSLSWQPLVCVLSAGPPAPHVRAWASLVQVFAFSGLLPASCAGASLCDNTPQSMFHACAHLGCEGIMPLRCTWCTCVLTALGESTWEGSCLKDNQAFLQPDLWQTSIGQSLLPV